MMILPRQFRLQIKMIVIQTELFKIVVCVLVFKFQLEEIQDYVLGFCIW